MSNDFQSSWFNSRLNTNPEQSTGRLQVDAQQTSYEENRQFRFFDRIDGLSSNNQLVYKLETVNPITVGPRVIELWGGGREYLVYPDDGNVTFTGTLGSALPIRTVNTIKAPWRDTLPASGVTIRKATGNGIFTSTSDPVNGTGLIAEGQGSSKSTTYSQSGERAGVGAGVSFWLVFNHLSAAGNKQTNGQYRLSWEEENI